MKALLLGGAGFIGSNLSRKLRADGHHVVVVDSLVPQVHGAVPKLALLEADEFYREDLADRDWPERSGLAGRFFDVVYFLVAETGTAQSMWQSERHVRSNLITLALLNELQISFAAGPGRARSSLGFTRLVLASSRAVYQSCHTGDSGELVASRETDPIMPLTVYGATKAGQEALVQGGFPGAQKVILRLQNVYGPGQPASNPYTGVVATFISRSLRNLDIHLFSSHPVVRDFVYIEDVISALMMAASDSQMVGETINIGTGRTTSVEELARLVIDLTASKSKVIVEQENDFLLGHIPAGLACVEKMEAFGIKCGVSLPDGLSKLLAVAEGNAELEAVDDQFDRYLADLKSYGSGLTS